MAFKPYTDPTTGEIVGEFETRDTEGSVSRQTEWFATEQEAKRFSRTGPDTRTEGQRAADIRAAYERLLLTIRPEAEARHREKKRSHLSAI